MSNTLIRLGSTYTIPAVLAQPARPAYTTSETRTVYPLDPTSRWVMVREQVPGTSPPQYRETPRYLAAGVSSYTYTVLVYHPATPATPGQAAQRIDKPPAGWTSFARSAAFAFENVAVTFKAPITNAGAVLGLAHLTNPTVGYGHILHGVALVGDEIRSLADDSVLDTFADGDEIGIEVDGGAVSVTLNGSEIDTGTSALDPDRAAFLSAVLWGAQDSVYDPTIEQLAGASPAAQTISGTARAPAARAFSSQYDGIQSRAVGPLPIVRSYTSAVEPAPANESYARAPAALAASLVHVSSIITSTATAPAARALSADFDYIGSRAVSPAARALSRQEPNDMGYMLESFVFDVAARADGADVVDARESMTLDVTVSGVSGDVADAREAFTFDVESWALADNLADARDVFWFDVPMEVPADDVDAWAVNLDGFGSTTYSGFPFNSFANIGGRYFGAAMTGIHELEGDDDAGAPIQASIDFGVVSFGSTLKKTVAEAYLGMSGTGHLFLKIVAEGQEFIYRTRSYSEHMRAERVTLGKGLRPNYAGLQLFNEDGADFALDSVEFVPVTLSRRI